MSIEKAARVLEWKNGMVPGPWRLFVFPTYRCNLKCGYCSKALVPDPPDLRNEIPDERLLALVDESAELGVRDWFIGGGGEPMLRREVVIAMCEKVRGHGMHGVLQTNGTLLREEDIETLVRIGWNMISISVDGPDAETNDRIRWQKSFDKIVKALETINRYKEQYGREEPAINMAVVVTSMNCEKLEELVDLAHRLKFKSLVFNELYVHLEGLDAYILDAEQQRNLPQIVTRCLRKAEKYKLDNNFSIFMRALGSVESRELPPPTPEREDDVSRVTESICFDPWLSVSIVSSGNVGPCCVFRDPEADNIKDMTLHEAWTGPYMTAMRRSMLGNVPPEPCRACQSDFIRHNWEVRDALESIEAMSVRPAQLVRKTVAAVQKNGLSGAVKRGREWLDIRRKVRRTMAPEK